MKNVLLFSVVFLVVSSSLAQEAQPCAKKNDGNFTIPTRFDDGFGGSTLTAEKYYQINKKSSSKALSFWLDKCEKKNNDWIVFSDKKNTNVYKSYDTDSEISFQLDIGEQCYVTKYYDDRYAGRFLKIKTRKSKQSGWVKISDLILSNKPLKSSKSQSYYMAMVLMNVDNMSSEEFAEIKDASIKKQLYYQPSSNAKTSTTVSKFEYYYVFKETKVGKETWVLLAKDDKLKGSDKEIKSNLLGWIRESQITAWHHRICLEPTVNQGALKEYGYRSPTNPGQPILVAKDTSILKSTGRYDQELYVGRFFLRDKKLPGTSLRWPVLDEENYENFKKIACISTIETAESAASSDEKDRWMDKSKRATAKMSNMNILFVLDATRSLRKYGDKISESVDNVIDRINEGDGINANVRFSLAVFRDYQDGQGKYTKYENYKLLANLGSAEDVKDAIEILDFDSENQTVDSHYEAMHLGLHDGIKEVFSGKNLQDNSNIVILIGDAGNRKNEGPTVDEIVSLMEQDNINFVSYQVNDFDNPKAPYLAFNNSARKILKGLGEKYESLDFGNVSLKSSGNNQNKLTFSKILNNREMEKFTPVFGWYEYPTQRDGDRKKINPIALSKSITESIIDFIEKKKEEQIWIVQKIKGIKTECPCDDGRKSIDCCPDNPTEGLSAAYLKNFLKRQNPNATEKELEEMLLSIYDQGAANISGWVETVPGDRAILEPVAFLSQSDKKSIQRQMNKLAGAKDTNTTKTRNRFQQVMFELVVSLMGVEEENKAQRKLIEKMTLDEVWNKLLGVDFYDETIGSLQIDQLSQRNKLGKDDFDDFFNNFQKQVENFKAKNYDCTTDDCPSSFQSPSGEMYYWVPLGDIPGCSEYSF